jgi:hypothetical protein
MVRFRSISEGTSDLLKVSPQIGSVQAVERPLAAVCTP